MIEVVREHAQLFKGQFTNATCKDGIFWPAAHQTCPEDIQIEMLSSILPPFSVRSLSRSDWLLVRAHPETIDFSWVESVELSWFAEPVCKDLSNDWVLPRCRLLKTMYTRPFGPDRFKWVVQEKRDIDSLGSCTTTTADVLQQKEERPGYVEYGIVPMELIEIKEDCYDYPLYDEEVNDIVITFSHTLTSFRVEGRNTSSHDNPQKYLHIGRGWVEMPVLTKLHLYLGESNYRVVLDQKLMSHYPNLISIETEDKTRDYSFQDKVPCLPAFLLRLRILYLNGWSALTFNLETISTTTDLANITVRRPSSEWYAVFISTVMELYRSFGLQDRGVGETEEKEEELGNDGEVAERIVRSNWTWDWQLPILEVLCLSGEVAYIFQFKMLAGCPQLKYSI